MANGASDTFPISRVVDGWWPLAASWLLMAAEMPVLSAVVARLPQPEINLAAYGGVVMPISFVIESPIIMLLAASTTLSRDWDAYSKLRRYMLAAGAILTTLNLIVVLSPLYGFVVTRLLGAPAQIVEPARIGLLIMTPWTWAIAYRRFNQGVLIRFGHSRLISVGTGIRLGTEVLVLALGYAVGSLAGVVVATSAVVVGVVSESIYVGIRVQPVLRNQLRVAPPVTPALSWADLVAFYVPLMMTSLMSLVSQPIGSSAIGRMPAPLESLAAWPVVSGLLFLFRSAGIAYNEVVVSLLDRPHSVAVLRRFAHSLAIVTTAVLLLIAATPLSGVWFGRISGLSEPLVSLARNGLLAVILLPALNVYQSWYQGALLYTRRTAAISESVAIALVTSVLTLMAGVTWGNFPGLYVGLAALMLSMLAQTGWLWWRARPALRILAGRDLLPHLAAELNESK